MSYDPPVLDELGQMIRVGSRIRPWKPPTKLRGPAQPGGVVTQVTEPDGDVDDEGRPVAIYPYVYVLYDDGVEDRWPTSYQARGYDDPDGYFECDDVEVDSRRLARLRSWLDLNVWWQL